MQYNCNWPVHPKCAWGFCVSIMISSHAQRRFFLAGLSSLFLSVFLVILSVRLSSLGGPWQHKPRRRRSHDGKSWVLRRLGYPVCWSSLTSITSDPAVSRCQRGENPSHGAVSEVQVHERCNSAALAFVCFRGLRHSNIYGTTDQTMRLQLSMTLLAHAVNARD